MKSVVKKNAFTIVELVVAMGLLVILVGLSSVVFSTSVKAHRKATAAIEITRSLRVLTEQLNADFDSLNENAPLFLAFNRVDTDGDGTPDTQFDTIHFFADDNFQTTKQYDDGSGGQKTISGNMARIYYGHANSAEADDFQTYHVLSRKSHILTTDSEIKSVYDEIPLVSNWPTEPYALDYTQFPASFGILPSADIDSDENKLEFNTITLTQWVNALNYLEAGSPDNADHFIAECMDDDSRPRIDLTDYETLHLLMAQGVLDFSIQWAYTPDDLAGAVAGFDGGVRWWPSTDPDGDGDESDSDFDGMPSNGTDIQFGVYFTLPNGTSNTDWFAIQECQTGGVYFSDTFYPKALKFTFRLKDSNNIFPDGKTFTHIIYLNN